MNSYLKKWYDQYSQEAVELAHALWAHPETAFGEHFACEATAKLMERHGFDVKRIDVRGRGEQPNCVIATYGSGKPEIIILGELDALDGMGQEAVPHRAAVAGPGHGCGHCLFAASSAAAACALKSAMEAEGIKGTLKFYGCPAEEGGAGKVYLVHQGYFDHGDLALAWHPSGNPFYFGMSEGVSRAMNSMTFEFFGIQSHAGAAPERGRSALDAAELMNIGVQYLREHISSDVRMHYSYDSTGGMPPNIVPDYARTRYYIRSKDHQEVEEAVARVRKIAEGAALMTGTTVKYTPLAGVSETVVNHSVNRWGYQACLKVDPPAYTQEDQDFARELYRSVYEKEPDLELLPTVPKPPEGVEHKDFGSSDIADVSHLMPTIQFEGLGVICGIPPHHWAITACVGMHIGHEGMLFGSKAVAQLGYDAFTNPDIIRECQEEFKQTISRKPPYQCPMEFD